MGKIIMVTGATSGFGRAIAEKFATNGYDVIITGRRKDRLDILQRNILKSGSKVLPLHFDVRKRNETADIIEGIPNEWKEIDVLVNNAGLASGLAHIDEGDIDDWDTMIDTNVKGLLYVTRAVAPFMVKRNSGHIINIGSIAGHNPYENGNVYCASKAAVTSLSECIRIDLIRHNIRVTNISPGMAETEFSLVRFKGDASKANAVYNGIKALSADDIAGLVYYCTSLPEHVCINELIVTPTQQANAYYNYRR